MRNRLITAVLVLAISSGVIALVILAIPLGESAQEFASRGQLSAAIATTFALISGVIAIIVTTMLSSSDYKAEQAVKADTAALLAVLRSIMAKGSWMAVNPSKSENKTLDFSAEKHALNDFLLTTSAFGYWAWAGKKAGLAKAGTHNEWNLFFYYITEILASSDHSFLFLRASQLENLISGLSQNDLKSIGYDLNNMEIAIGNFEAVVASDPLISGLKRIVHRSDSKPEGSNFKAKLEFLKANGIDDPDIDLFLAVLTDGLGKELLETMIEEAFSRGASIETTDTELLRRHHEALKAFAKNGQ